MTRLSPRSPPPNRHEPARLRAGRLLFPSTRIGAKRTVVEHSNRTTARHRHRRAFFLPQDRRNLGRTRRLMCRNRHSARTCGHPPPFEPGHVPSVGLSFLAGRIASSRSNLLWGQGSGGLQILDELHRLDPNLRRWKADRLDVDQPASGARSAAISITSFTSLRMRMASFSAATSLCIVSVDPG
jgi:hypothetical protein